MTNELLNSSSATSPQADFLMNNSSNSIAIEVGSILNLNSSSLGDIVSWKWDFNNDGIIDSTLEDPQFTFGVSGTYYISLTVTDSIGDSDSITKSVLVVDNIQFLEENVYRFRNNDLGGSAHFYVLGDANRDKVINNSKPGGIWAGTFTYETIAFKAYQYVDSCVTGTVPVYRFLNNKYGSVHFYIVGEANKNTLIEKTSKGGVWENAFAYERVAFCVFDSVQSGTEPVGRFRNNILGGSVHFYITGVSEINNLKSKVAPGGAWAGAFTFESNAFYAYPADEMTTETFNSEFFNIGFEYDSTLNIDVNSSRVVTTCLNQTYEPIANYSSNTEWIQFDNNLYISIVGCLDGYGGGSGSLTMVDEYTLTSLNGKTFNIE
ncbi:MAG: PKD domain-containing protein [Candidatus Dojkabacteria bacterium]|nr:PKD domain-containing protein [Candidatus Dojkabacteria bacterium]